MPCLGVYFPRNTAPSDCPSDLRASHPPAPTTSQQVPSPPASPTRPFAHPHPAPLNTASPASPSLCLLGVLGGPEFCHFVHCQHLERCLKNNGCGWGSSYSDIPFTLHTAACPANSLPPCIDLLSVKVLDKPRGTLFLSLLHSLPAPDTP